MGDGQNKINTTEKIRITLQDFIVPILARKINILLFIYLFIVSLSFVIQENALIMLLLAFISNLIIYMVNDILDYKLDIKEKPIRAEKLFARGILDKKDIGFMISIGVISLIILGYISPTASILMTSIILLNIIRSLIHKYSVRTILLFFIEILNFEVVWWIMVGALIPAIVLPVFIMYAMIYSVVQYLYKKDMFHTILEFKTFTKIVTVIFLFTVLTSFLPLVKFSAYPIIALTLIVLISGVLFLFMFKKYFDIFYSKEDAAKYSFINMITLNYLIIFAIIFVLLFPGLRDLLFPIPLPEGIEQGINYVVKSADNLQKQTIDNISHRAETYKELIQNNTFQYI